MYLVTDAEVVIGGILIVFTGMVAIVGLLYLISGAIKFGTSAGECTEGTGRSAGRTAPDCTGGYRTYPAPEGGSLW